MSLLEVQDLRVTLRQHSTSTRLLRDVSLSMEYGKVLGLVGESGAGKSMVAKAILDLLPKKAVIDKGEIKFNQNSLLRLSVAERRKLLGKDIALIPQDPMVSLNPVRTIGTHLSEGLTHHLGITKAEARKQSIALLDEVLIRDPERVIDAFSHELSGGMRQRVLIAMAFSCSPKLIIADEPTTALDVTVQKRVLSLIRMMQRKQNTSLLFITHDLGVVAKICDQVAIMYEGRVLENTTAKQLFHSPGHDYTRALIDAMPRFDQPDKPILPVSRKLKEQLQAETREVDQATYND
ncbi:MAG: ABC transporter ATP-binding protein [Acidiferrobacterales bacterium]|nr:ABC transporter ATP-binding protein [Acidiferrobacterales bacterium]